MSERTKETLYPFRNKFYWEVKSVPETMNPDGERGINYPYNPTVANIWGEPEGVAKERAQLFAAAPDMYEALKVTRDGLIGEFGQRVYLVNFGRIEEAIAKAEGR